MKGHDLIKTERISPHPSLYGSHGSPTISTLPLGEGNKTT